MHPGICSWLLPFKRYLHSFSFPFLAFYWKTFYTSLELSGPVEEVLSELSLCLNLYFLSAFSVFSLFLVRDGGLLWRFPQHSPPAAALAPCEHQGLPAAHQELVWGDGVPYPADGPAVCLGGEHGLGGDSEKGAGTFREMRNLVIRTLRLMKSHFPFLPGAEQTFASTRQGLLLSPVWGGSALSLGRRWCHWRWRPDILNTPGGRRRQHKAEKRASWAPFLLGVPLHPRPCHFGMVHVRDISYLF